MRPVRPRRRTRPYSRRRAFTPPAFTPPACTPPSHAHRRPSHCHRLRLPARHPPSRRPSPTFAGLRPPSADLLFEDEDFDETWNVLRETLPESCATAFVTATLPEWLVNKVRERTRAGVFLVSPPAPIRSPACLSPAAPTAQPRPVPVSVNANAPNGVECECTDRPGRLGRPPGTPHRPPSVGLCVHIHRCGPSCRSSRSARARPSTGQRQGCARRSSTARLASGRGVARSENGTGGALALARTARLHRSPAPLACAARRRLVGHDGSSLPFTPRNRPIHTHLAAPFAPACQGRRQRGV